MTFGLELHRLYLYTVLVIIYISIRLSVSYIKKWIFYGIISVALVESMIAYLQLVGIINTNHSAFPCTGTFNNPAPLGGIVALAIIIAMDKIKSHRIMLIAIVIMLPALVCSDSRAAWIACGTIALFRAINLFKWKSHWKFGVIAGVLILSAIPLYNHKPNSANARVLIWKICGNMIAESPLIGQGTNAVERLYMQYQADYFENSGIKSEKLIVANNNHAFNEFIDITCSYGIIGLILFILLLIMCFMERKTDKRFIEYISCLLIFGMFSYPFDVSLFLIIFTILLASLPCGVEYNSVSKYNKIILACIVLIPMALTIIRWNKYQVIEKSLREYHWDKNAVEYVHDKMEEFVHEPQLMAEYGRILFETKDYNRAIPILEQMSKLRATPNVYYDLGYCYENIGMTKKAENCYMLTAKMLPAYITPQYKLFKLYKSKGELNKAIATARYILDMPLKKKTFETERIKREALKHLTDNGL